MWVSPSLSPQSIFADSAPHPAACAPPHSAGTGVGSRGGHRASPGSSAWWRCGRPPSARWSLSGCSGSPACPGGGAARLQSAHSVRCTASRARRQPSHSALCGHKSGGRKQESVSESVSVGSATSVTSFAPSTEVSTGMAPDLDRSEWVTKGTQE